MHRMIPELLKTIVVSKHSYFHEMDIFPQIKILLDLPEKDSCFLSAAVFCECLIAVVDFLFFFGRSIGFERDEHNM